MSNIIIGNNDIQQLLVKTEKQKKLKSYLFVLNILFYKFIQNNCDLIFKFYPVITQHHIH